MDVRLRHRTVLGSVTRTLHMVTRTLMAEVAPYRVGKVWEGRKMDGR